MTRTPAEELWQHRRRSAYQGDDELVFCHPQRGSIYRYDAYKAALEQAFESAGIEWPEKFRPCHDLRVSGATHDALGNMQEAKMLTKCGWSDPRVAQRYINLAGVVFRDEAQAFGDRLLGGSLSTEPSTDLRAPERIEDALAALRKDEQEATDGL